MSGQKIIDGLQEAIDGKVERITEFRVWREGDCPCCQGTGKQLRVEVAKRQQGRQTDGQGTFSDER